MKYAIISDIHEDVVSLRLALRKIEKLGCDEIICLGDISGYNVQSHHFLDIRNASKCLAMVKDNCSVIIAGNHDLHAAQRIPRFMNGFIYPSDWYQLDYHKRRILSDEKVWLYDDSELKPLYNSDDINFLRTLPEYQTFRTPNKNILFTHFIYPNLSGNYRDFYTDNEDFDSHKKFIKKHDCQIGFTGHRHFPGLVVSKEDKIIKKRYNRPIRVTPYNCILVPAIVRNKANNGFCVYNEKESTVIAKRI